MPERRFWNPSVDQLAAAIGFTLVLNKIKKHGTAVFSGDTPSTIEFLEPEKTIEKNTDSLRDFIVALDKSKADKLRYKVEDKFVKIFITPYHTSLSENDLEFGQGDFNVDVIIALGVGRKEELDEAITAHGRILHDATVVSITRVPGEDMGAINWHVPEASSFSEVLVGLSDSLKSPNTELFDEQIATAFLTGIVAETDRFSNDKTTPQTMTMAAILMKAGANQQLIATKLDEPAPVPEASVIMPTAAPLAEMPAMPMMPDMPAPPPPPPAPVEPPVSRDGSLQIAHPDSLDAIAADVSQSVEPPVEPPGEEIHIDDEGTLHKFGQVPASPIDSDVELASGLPAVNPSDMPGAMPMLNHDDKQPADVDHDDQTLEEIERAVKSPHLKDLAPATEQALAPPPDAMAPPANLNATPVDLDLGHGDQPFGAPADDPNSPPTMPPPII
jgi:hypothetical protein